jgi:5-formyltetrahydrofolate cyclo-ligase
MTKEQIRIHHKKLRNMISVEERKFYSQLIQEKLRMTIEYQNCSHLFAFVSFGTEVNTLDIIRQAFIDNRKVFVPKVEAYGMEFYEIHSLEGLISSKFGVPEPSSSEDNRYKAVIHSNETELENRLMLLPGLAFDSTGNRIGYGAGYYDRYLSKFPASYFYKMAIAYDFQLMEQIAAEDYDIKADAIVTPTQRIQCSIV